MIVALAGGIGASKLLLGLSHVLDAADLTVIVNTGDDFVLHGLTICPDLDTTAYTLGGVADLERGWGVDGDTFSALSWLRRYGREAWFQVGDRDLATHLHRTALLREGRTLAEVTDRIRRSLGVRARILPMTNALVSTIVLTDRGPTALQEYLVRDGAKPAVRGISFDGVVRSRPAPGVLEAIETCQGVILCPSNPIISIGPILSVPGIRDALRTTGTPVVGVSPVVGGRSLKGPTDKLLAGLGYDVSALSVARIYQDLLDLFIIDRVDAELIPAIEALQVRVRAAAAVMGNLEAKISLAKETISCLESLRPS
ncbi:MAG: 2-phospho-L-lactate transferase [Candidatus Methylomirabilaceae bacterium]